MDLVPVLVDGAIVCNIRDVCEGKVDECDCAHLAICLHNWVLTSNLHYLVIDLQDKKDVCEKFLEEIVLLRRRLSMPLIFVGAKGKSKEYLNMFAFNSYHPTFLTPEDAAQVLRDYAPSNFNRSQEVAVSSLSHIFGQSLKKHWEMSVEH